MSQITTHILDTSKGRPAANVPVTLYHGRQDVWTEIGRDKTNNDGRATGLLVSDAVLSSGQYKLRFDTKEYFDKLGVYTLYPFVEITFLVESHEHYHIPLLLSPHGYTTYRGS